LRIADLRAGMKRVEIKAKVVEIGAAREVMTKFGDVGRVATAVISDESGSIKLALWNELIERVSVGDTIHIENGYVTTFRGENQLNVGRYGKLTTVQ